MEFQHKVILSLGSNKGDRRDYLQRAIFGIHDKVATVIRLSRVYETPAWGFKADAFLNCAALVHTNLTPEVLLGKLLQIEKSLGRERSRNGYESRTIDIDIIAFGSEIIDKPEIKIPHPQMGMRRFVLEPMLDLNLSWVHPVLQKTVAEMLESVNDELWCVPVDHLELPMKSLRLNQLNYLAIEGNIGAGKTTLTHKIAEDFNAKTVLERFADNPFLPKFYEDSHRYAFPLEMSFLADRYQQIADDLGQFDLFRDFIVADYHLFKSLIFAKVTLTEDEYRLYRKLFDIIYREMPKPDLYVYLYQNTERLLQNIKTRGRSYESDIQAEYLEKINRGYFEFMKTQPDLNILIIDVSTRDFVNNQQDYSFVLEQIQDKISAR